ncbi:MAG: hypothetical protein Q7S06_00145 [Nanoarchaeota archaeon]|nr:hypothetical protein [Nanoarchaeota archaeon]
MPEEENHEDDEEIEVEVLEFAVGDEEIDELITKLNELKKTKTSFEFEIDEDTDLLIHHEEDEELNEEEEEGEEI